MLKDSLAVERAKLLQMIGELEVTVASLRDVDARVSKRLVKDLGSLRHRVESSQSKSKFEPLLDAAIAVLARVATEVLKRLS